jgi:hypothetical protein
MATIKISDIEALLKIPVPADVELYGVALNTIQEMSNLFGKEVEATNSNVWVSIPGNGVTVTLNSVNKSWK